MQIKQTRHDVAMCGLTWIIREAQLGAGSKSAGEKQCWAILKTESSVSKDFVSFPENVPDPWTVIHFIKIAYLWGEIGPEYKADLELWSLSPGVKSFAWGTEKFTCEDGEH